MPRYIEDNYCVTEHPSKATLAAAREAAGIVCRALDLAKNEHDEDEALALFDTLTRENGEFPDAQSLADNLDLLWTDGAVQ